MGEPAKDRIQTVISSYLLLFQMRQFVKWSQIVTTSTCKKKRPSREEDSLTYPIDRLV
ncbi:hypothetical protein EV199_0683 [Pseudobacter ginsenosidimutans]|uniref:Uncharacterized protein n=1 Tax=Pseudobacter ginsenosidimutans TaxID=661488 RepID=A0A4Q7N0Y8_9BACT|nr:hypothetical protein EV199_0683 [Pseudobacter ginsenosidimutans]